MKQFRCHRPWLGSREPSYRLTCVRERCRCYRPHPFPYRPRRKTRAATSGDAASCSVASAPVVAAEPRDRYLGVRRGRVLAGGGGAGRGASLRWCRRCRRRRELCGGCTRGWGRHARVARSVVVLSLNPLALLSSPAASAHPGGRSPLCHRLDEGRRCGWRTCGLVSRPRWCRRVVGIYRFPLALPCSAHNLWLRCNQPVVQSPD